MYVHARVCACMLVRVWGGCACVRVCMCACFVYYLAGIQIPICYSIRLQEGESNMLCNTVLGTFLSAMCS